MRIGHKLLVRRGGPVGRQTSIASAQRCIYDLHMQEPLYSTRSPCILLLGLPDYAPSSAKPWDCKTSGNQCVGAFRRLFALSVASIPARVSTDSHLPRACTTCSKRGFTGAWQGTRG